MTLKKNIEDTVGTEEYVGDQDFLFSTIFSSLKGILTNMSQFRNCVFMIPGQIKNEILKVYTKDFGNLNFGVRKRVKSKSSGPYFVMKMWSFQVLNVGLG